MNTKICNKCNIKKPITEYHKQHTAKDGTRNTCKLCICESQKDYLKVNRDVILQKKKEYRESDKGKKIRQEQRRCYYLKHKTDENIRSNNWNKTNREKMKEYKNDYEKEYRIKNKESVAWRRLLHNTLKKLGQTKEGHTIDLLGYSVLELKEHLESLFTDGMTWDNYGEWHIDHIKPVSSFDKDTLPNVVNALSNLQPLWATTREINGVVNEGNLKKNKY